MFSVVKEVLMLVNQISDIKYAIVSHGLVREICLLENTFITFFSTAPSYELNNSKVKNWETVFNF